MHEMIRKPEKKERHWLFTAIPVWIAVIAVSLFLCSERHLIAYDNDKPVMDISYSIWQNQLNQVILYGPYGEKAATLSQRNGFGARKLIMNFSGDNADDDVYMYIYYTDHLRPTARVEHYGINNTRTIYYAENGLVESMEETTDGITTVYRFVQQQDDRLIYPPELLNEYIGSTN